MKNVKCAMVVVFMVVMALAVPASAVDYWNSLSMSSWGTGSNWFDGTAPTSGDDVQVGFTTNFGPVIGPGVNAVCATAYIGAYGYYGLLDGRVDMTTDGTLTAGALVLGSYGTTYGEFNMSGGAATIAGNMWLALNAGNTGTANISGGTLSMAGTLVMAFSTVTNGMLLNISGTGTVSAGTHWVDHTGKAVITISDSGKLILAGENPWFVSDNLGYGSLKAGPGQTIASSYDLVNDKLTIYAVPEPMTLALLGLGGLFVARRKKA
jgi:hypothetical protein